MEERPYFSPSSGDSGSGNSAAEEESSKKATFSLKGGSGGKKWRGGAEGKLPRSWKKIALLLLLGVVFLFLANSLLCSGGDSGNSNNIASQEQPDSTPESTTNDATGDGSASQDLVTGTSERKEYSGDVVIDVAGEEITSEEVDEREVLIADYLKINDVTDLATEEKREAAIYQLIQVAWSRAISQQEGIEIPASRVRSEAKKGGGALTKNLLAAGYSEAQVEDLIRLELVRQELKKEARAKAKKVKMSKVRKAYKKAGIKKPFSKVKKKLKNKIRKKQIAQANKKFDQKYDQQLTAETACASDYKVDACGSNL